MPVLVSDGLDADPRGATLLRRCLSEGADYRARAAMADGRVRGAPHVTMHDALAGNWRRTSAPRRPHLPIR